jgi:hypothetical protein
VWSNGSGSCGGGSLVIGGAFNVRQVKDDNPDEMGYAGPPDSGLSVGLNTNH